jgi:hypothetical protein
VENKKCIHNFGDKNGREETAEEIQACVERLKLE